MTHETHVLFVNTKTQSPGADTWIHTQIMRDLDRSTNQLTVACAIGRPDDPTPTYRIIKGIPDLRVHPVDFGSELTRRSRGNKVRAGIDGLRAARSLAQLVLFVRRHRVQIVHTSDRPRDAVASVVLARLTGTKCIIHAHVAYGDWMSRALKWSLKRADALLAVSHFVGQSLVANGHDPAKIHVVLNAIDPDAWRWGEGREEIREELAIPADAPVLITVCRLFPEKGPEVLIRRLPVLRAAYPDVVLVVVGEQMLPGYRQHLCDVADDLGVAENVRLVGYRSDVPRLMAAADVYVMASREEPFGLVYLEAMAMRLPVVAIGAGGTPEVVVNGVTGLLSDLDDVEQLAANILSLLEHPELRHLMGDAGRRRVEASFTTPRMAADVDAVYKKLTSTADLSVDVSLVPV
jgi:glycosyltransferase involved in cell wall biosynthesis